MPSLRNGLMAALSLAATAKAAITLDVGDTNSIIAAANIAKDQMLSFYPVGKPYFVPGLVDQPFFWWEAGAMFGQLVQHRHLTGNKSLDQLIADGLQFQIGINENYEPQNQSLDLGNDDQQFWAYAVMDAAETAFPDPPSSQPSWLALAQAVFNRQVQRWEPAYCNGGLEWQIFFTNPGWGYKNTPANGGLAHLGARLARYTGNDTYAVWAEKIYDWLEGVQYIQETSPGVVHVYDGGHYDQNCTDINKVEYTYNAGTLLSACAYMFSYNSDQIWLTRATKLIAGIKQQFLLSPITSATAAPKFPDPAGTILSETSVEYSNPQKASNDQPAFKAFLIRSLAMASQLMPSLADQILPIIEAGAPGAAVQCSGTTSSEGVPGTTWCGRRWYQSSWDGFNGLGEQMSAMSVFQNLLIKNAALPFTAKKGGTSVGNAAAGSSGDTNVIILPEVLTREITGADKFGAAVLTIIGVAIAVGGTVFMIM